MDPPMHYITADGMGSLEVIAGIAPVSQGGDSIAGAVIAKSAAPQFGSGDGMRLFGKVAASYSGANDAAPCCCARAAPVSRPALLQRRKTARKDLKFPGGTVKDAAMS